MKKRLKIILIFLACISLSSSVITDSITTTWATDQGDIDDAQNQADALQQKVDELQAQMDEITGGISSTQDKISELDTMLEGLTSQSATYEAQISAKQVEITNKLQEISAKEAEITTTQASLDAAKASEVSQFEAMKARIQYMYEQGDETFLEMIFSAKDMSDFLGKTEYVRSITEYDRNQLQKLVDTENEINTLLASLESQKTALEAEKTTLESQKSDLVAMQADLDNQQVYVNTVLSEKQNLLGTLDNQEAATEDQIAQAQEELATQQQMVENLKLLWEKEQAVLNSSGGSADEALAAKLSEIGIAGGFTWPLPGYNTITSPYGYRDHPTLHQWLLHDGIDISGSGVHGKPIVAAYKGTVIMAQANGGYGYCIQIDHGSGVITLYAHCSVIAVSVGQTVSAGEVIGYVGGALSDPAVSRGNSTGAHLHFSLFIQGASVNPLDYVIKP